MSNTFSVYNCLRSKAFDLGKGNWFGIQRDANYRVFKMTEWSEDDLTNFVFFATASSQFTGTLTMSNARKVARALIEWAGTDDLVAFDEGDNAVAEARSLGLKLSKKRAVESRYDHYTENRLDDLTEDERIAEINARDTFRAYMGF